jgi:hypothetical protein
VRRLAIRRIGRHPPVVATVLLLAAWVAFQAWTAWSGGAKLRAVGLDHVTGQVHVEVVLRITPEPFHMAIFQDSGRLIAVREPSVFVMDVPPDKLRSLAAYYWVQAIRPWAGM